MLIANWKYVEFYIDHELCYPDELWIYMHQLIENTTVKTERFDIKAAIKDYNNPWKSEKKLYHIIRDLFVNEDVISHYHAHWLENLELDIYIVDYRIGIEYQGVQHYKPVKI